MNMKRRFSQAGLAVLLTSFLVCSLWLAGFAVAEAGKAAITIDPPSGKKSTPITIAGTGFQPQEEVDIVIILGPGQRVGLGTTELEVVVADENGAFSVPSAIPMNAKPGAYEIEVEGNQGSVFNTSIEVTE